MRVVTQNLKLMWFSAQTKGSFQNMLLPSMLAEMACRMKWHYMKKEAGRSRIILVVEDVEETRDGIEKLLKADGYLVDPARDEEDAVVRAKRQHPDLILTSPGSPGIDVIAAARRIRRRAKLGVGIPVVIFGGETVAEGGEVEIGKDVYVTRPDNFDQLRRLLSRLLRQSPTWSSSRPPCLRPAVDQIRL